MVGEDDMTEGDDAMEICLNNDLERQICEAIDSRFLLQFVSHLEILKCCDLHVNLYILSKSVFTS